MKKIMIITAMIMFTSLKAEACLFSQPADNVCMVPDFKDTGLTPEDVLNIIRSGEIDETYGDKAFIGKNEIK